MSNAKKDNPKYYAKLFGFRRAVPIILAALGVFIAVCFFTEGAGLLGGSVSSLLKGLFSFGAYFIPPLLILHAVFYAGDYVKRLTVSRTIFSVVTVFLVSGIEYIAYFWSEPVFDPSLCYITQTAGGFLGSIVGFALTKVLGPAGVIILSVTVIAVYATYFFATGNSMASRSVMRVFSSVKGFFSGIGAKIKGAGAEKKAKLAELERIESEKRTGELLADNFFTSDESISELKIEKLGINEKNEAAVPQKEASEPSVEEEPPAPFEAKKTEKPRRHLNLDYGLGIEGGSSGARASTERVDVQSENSVRTPSANTVSRAAMGLDDTADNVFTKEFDPFDFATAEKVIVRPAPRTVPSGIGEVASPLSNVTERDVEIMRAKEAAAKRAAEFEERKRRILENAAARGVSGEVSADQYGKPDRSSTISKAEGKASGYSTTAQSAAQQSAYSAPAQSAAQQSAYSTPAHSAAQQSAYSAPPQSAAQQSGYSAPAQSAAQPSWSGATASQGYSSAAASAHAKTVEYNIEVEDKSDAPEEGDAVTFVFDKSEHYPDETQRIAAEVAEMLEKNVTGYTRSANKSFTYTRVTEAVGNDAAGNSFDMPTSNATVHKGDGMFPLGLSGEGAAHIEDRAASSDDLATAYTSGSEKASDQGITLNEYSTSENETPSDHGFEEYRASEALTQDDATQASDESASSDRMIMERTMIEPLVDSSSVISERDSKFTVISADKESDYDKAVEDSAQSISLDALIFDDESDATELSFEGESDETSPDNDPDDLSAIFGDEENSDASNIPEDELAADPEEIPPEEQNPEILKQRQLFPFLDNNPVDDTDTLADSDDDADSSSAEDLADPSEDEPPFDIPEDDAPKESAVSSVPFVAPAAETALVPEKEAKKSAPKAPSYKNFKFPPIDMLTVNDEISDSNVDDEIQENADRLIDTLSSFNVTASIKGVDRGPRITRYEVVPAKGVKVSSIMSLQDDIALSLAADGIRMEAPIPGKSAVGVEIPNKQSTTVRLRELLETDEFKSEKSKTAICIGKDVAGQPVINDISKMPHLLIAGATGMGKSVCINSLLISILYKARPDEVKLIMIDPKQVEFTMYNGIPHLLIPVVSDAKQAAGALMWAVDEMEKRFTQLNSACVRNVDSYNEKVAMDPSIGEPMSKIIIVIDEFADLMLQVKDPVESLVMRIAQKARAAGIHLIIGTQRPSTNVITGTIKANIPSRISCKVASNVDSRTVLDSVGAEKLLNRGDMLFAYSGAIKPLRVQGAFVSDGEVQNIMNHLKQFSTGDNYDEAVMEEIKRQAAKCNKKGSDGDDDRDSDESSGEGFLNDRQFLEAVEVAVNSGKISTSLLQRKISIGYGKAAKFIDVMCDMGIVGESNGSKPREVLITADEWREKLSRITYD